MRNDRRSSGAATDSYRRDVMKLLGAGTAVGAFGGTAAARERPPGQMDGAADDDEEETADEGDAGSDGSVHVVRTLIAQSTTPERPADFLYQPTGIHVEPGDVIRFVFETPDHTVTSYHPAFGMQRRIPAGVRPFSSPVMGWKPESMPDDIDLPAAGVEPAEGAVEEDAEEAPEADSDADAEDDDEADGMAAPTPGSWLHAFDTPGVYDLECAPHEGFGMAMRVVVGEETETDFETSDVDELPPPRAGPVDLSRAVLTDPNLEPDAIVEAGRVEWMDLEVNAEPESGDPDDGETDEGTDEETDDAIDVENGIDDGAGNVTDDGNG